MKVEPSDFQEAGSQLQTLAFCRTCRPVIQALVTAQAREAQVQGQPEHLSLSLSLNEKYQGELGTQLHGAAPQWPSKHTCTQSAIL